MRSTALITLTSLLLVGVFTTAGFALEDAPVPDAEATASEGGEAAPAESVAATPAQEQGYAIDNLFLMICAVLVLFMQAGFAMVEVGFNSSRNILFKNLMDLCIGVTLFYFVGYGLMYPGESFAGGWFGFGGVGIAAENTISGVVEAGGGKLSSQADWLFQVAFAATAATIVSGAVAGRMKFSAYLVYSAVLTGLIYPISGMWKWGGGWLATFGDIGFQDFAGSLVVHAVGGFAGLAGAMVLGPRLGRYTADGKPSAMPGHNLTVASLGVLILWVGWYGFNPGSQLAFASVDNTNATMLIAVNTTIAAAAGGFVSMLASWVMFKKPDLSMALNGVLAGLVGITANCDRVTNNESFIIGAVAGVLVVAAIVALDKCRIDDPVGAFPVHGVCGVWGGIATGIFGAETDMLAQVVGSVAIPIWAFVTMFILFSILKATGNLRVTADEETRGLDITEHGMSAYS